MSKISCEICGTSYQDTMAACPICGWSNSSTGVSADPDEFDLDFLQEESAAPAHSVEEPAVAEEPARRVPARPGSRKNREVFDYDAVNGSRPRVQPQPKPVPQEEPEEEEEVEYEEEDSHTNPFLVILLVILIVTLLLTSGYIFWKYYLPTRSKTEAPVATEPATTAATEQTEPLTVPCAGLSLVSGMEKLTKEGQNWLLHIKAVPEDTTDEIKFFSEDESVVTVNEEGRVTAVGEGETRIVITCGEQKIECPAVVSYQVETEPTVAEPVVAETVATEAPAETEAPATEAPTAPASNVTLKLKKTDISLGRRYVYVTLELDCDLKPEDVQWSTLNSNVATVFNGDVTAMGPGITTVIAKYGDQQVECIVRCKF